jgi:transposase
MVFVGVDWAEAHHDICVVDEAGKVLGKRRVPAGLEGVRQIHELVAAQAEQPEQVVVGIETDRGLLVGALLAAGYQVYAINPLSASRYRERHVTSRAKSDPGDAKVLADLVRTDRHNHRPVAGDSELAEAVKVLARAHQDLVWSRQRFVNRLRNTLREFYPAALAAFKDLDSPEILNFGRQSIPTFMVGHRLNSGPFGTMRVGLPFGLGAKVACPDKPVLVLHGDGSFGLNAMEVDTAVRTICRW